ncbi:unnamed protein product [Allacma fusca]|uniref:Uncharacterized protein n=1 Tax=Allacma fusca TaxID=39272 RepID=A0A8J2L3H8_9HEXA|nr:unnamed protein product [Allacma fusca]
MTSESKGNIEEDELLLKSMNSLAIDIDSAKTSAPVTPDLIRESKLNYGVDSKGPLQQLNSNTDLKFRFRNVFKDSDSASSTATENPEYSHGGFRRLVSSVSSVVSSKAHNGENVMDPKWIKIKGRSPNIKAKSLVPKTGIQKKSPLPRLRRSPGAKRSTPNVRVNPRQRPTPPKLKTPGSCARKPPKAEYPLLDGDCTPFWWQQNQGMARTKIPKESLQKYLDPEYSDSNFARMKLLEDQICSIATLKSDISKTNAVQELRLSLLKDEDFNWAIALLSKNISECYFEHEILARKAKIERREVQERLYKPCRASVPRTPAKK